MSFWHFCNRTWNIAAAAILTFILVQSSVALADPLYTVELKMKGGYFIPETLEVPAGQKIKIVLINEGPGAEEFESTELRKEKVLAPGAISFVTIAPLKPGTYRFYGEFHPETAQGKIVAR